MIECGQLLTTKLICFESQPCARRQSFLSHQNKFVSLNVVNNRKNWCKLESFIGLGSHFLLSHFLYAE